MRLENFIIIAVEGDICGDNELYYTLDAMFPYLKINIFNDFPFHYNFMVYENIPTLIHHECTKILHESEFIKNSNNYSIISGLYSEPGFIQNRVSKWDNINILSDISEEIDKISTSYISSINSLTDDKELLYLINSGYITYYSNLLISVISRMEPYLIASNRNKPTNKNTRVTYRPKNSEEKYITLFVTDISIEK